MGWFSEAAILGLGERGCMQLQWRRGWNYSATLSKPCLSAQDSCQRFPSHGKVVVLGEGSQEMAREPHQCHLPASSKSLLFTATFGRGCVQSMRQNWWARWIWPGSDWELQSHCRLTAALASQKGSAGPRSLFVPQGSHLLLLPGVVHSQPLQSLQKSDASWEQLFFTLPRCHLLELNLNLSCLIPWDFSPWACCQSPNLLLWCNYWKRTRACQGSVWKWFFHQ